MRILVTGASGFVGRHVVRALLSAGHVVRTLDRTGGEASPRVERCVLDLAGEDDLMPALADVDAVVHLAASMRGGYAVMARNTLGGTRRLLEAMRRAQVRRLVHASSFTVYRRDTREGELTEASPIHDDASLAACDDYARMKVEQERLVREAARTVNGSLTVLRAAVVWGTGQWGLWVLGPRTGPVQWVVGPAAPARLVYVEHAADAFAAAVDWAAPGERILNLVDDPVVSRWRYARALGGHCPGWKVAVPYGVARAGTGLAFAVTAGGRGLPGHLRPDRFAAMYRPMTWTNQALRRTLQWSPRFTFEQALARATGAAGSDP